VVRGGFFGAILGALLGALLGVWRFVFLLFFIYYILIELIIILFKDDVKAIFEFSDNARKLTDVHKQREVHEEERLRFDEWTSLCLYRAHAVTERSKDVTEAQHATK
jgi:MFS family permease